MCEATRGCGARSLYVWVREENESQRAPRPLPQELVCDGAMHRDKQAQGEKEASGRRAQREDDT